MIGQIGKRVVSFGISIVLARLLAPDDFGLMAMAMFIIGFVEVFYELGIGSAIIQKKELSSELLSSLFFINIAFSLLLSASSWFCGPTFAAFYGDPRVAPIIQILGLSFVINSFGVVQEALLRRNMCFDRLVRIELFVVFIDGTIAITLAYLGWKVWALVTAVLVSKTALTLLLCMSSSWRPKLCFFWTEVRKVLLFSLNLSGFKIVNYFGRNAHNFIIGRFLGASPLGYYSLAYKLSMYPLESISTVVGRVLFPACARIQDDKAELRMKYQRACGGIALIICPIMIGLCVVTRPLVIALLGAKWSPAIPIIMILAPIGMLQSIVSVIAHQIFLVKGRSDLLFWWGIGSGIAITLSFFCGLPWGLIGVASAYAIIAVPLIFLGLMLSFRLINLHLKDLVSTLRPYFSASVFMGLLVLGLRLTLEHLGFSYSLVLVVCVVVGILTYVSIILNICPPALVDIINILPHGMLRFINRHSGRAASKLAKLGLIE